MKVIGTGLGRTGTMSLKKALEQLYGGKCFHMTELLHLPKRIKYLKAYEKNGATDWAALFEGFNTVTDYPICLYYETLLEKYPDAKFVHTIRNPEKWYASVRETIYRGKPKNVKEGLRLVYNLIRSSDMRKVAPVFQYNDKVIWGNQFQNKFENKAFAIDTYLAHTERVKATIPKEKLLIFSVKDGWASLCDFLNLPVPETPFPQTHQRKNFNVKMDRLIMDGVLEM